MPYLENFYSVVFRTATLIGCMCSVFFVASAQIPDFDLDSNFKEIRVVQNGTFSTERGHYVADDITISSFMRIAPRPNSTRDANGRRVITAGPNSIYFTANQVHLDDCLFFDFDDPMPSFQYGKPPSDPPPPPDWPMPHQPRPAQ